MGRRKRGWNANASLSLADLRRIVEQKEAQVIRLQARRAELASGLDEVDTQLRAATGGAAGEATGRATGEAAAAAAPIRRGRKPGRPRKVGRPRKAGRPPKAAIQKAAKRGRPAGKRGASRRGPRGDAGLHNMIREALASSGEPMKLADLAKKVLDAGYQTSSSRFSVIVGQRLSEMKDVKKAGRGMYTVKGGGKSTRKAPKKTARKSARKPAKASAKTSTKTSTKAATRKTGPGSGRKLFEKKVPEVATEQATEATAGGSAS